MCIRGRAYVCTEYTVASIHRFDYSSILLACSLTRPLCSNLEAFSLSLSVIDSQSKRTRLLFIAPSLSLSTRVQLEGNSLRLETLFLPSSISTLLDFQALFSEASVRFHTRYLSLFHADKSFAFFSGFRVRIRARFDDYGSRRCFVSTLVTKSDDSFRPVAACNAIFSSLPRGLASGSDAINTLTKYAYHAYAYRLAFHARIINF